MRQATGGSSPGATRARGRGAGCVAPGGICVRGASVCFEPEPVVTRTNWSFVGPGHGGYERLNTYEYVGEGVGSYQQEANAAHATRRRVSACCIGCLVALAVAGGGGFVLGRLLAAGARPSSVAYALGLKAPEANATAGAAGSAGNLTVVTPARSYNCKDHYWGWRKEWSSDKMHWCCAHKGRGCPSNLAVNSTGPGRPAGGSSEGEGPPGEDVSAAVLDDSTSYKCDEGYSNWQAGWSTSKKDWCCLEENKGCQFDCSAGLENADAGWSPPKKLWCCQHEQKGCPTSGTTAGDDGAVVEALSAGAARGVGAPESATTTAAEPVDAAAGHKLTATMTSVAATIMPEEDITVTMPTASATTTDTSTTTAPTTSTVTNTSSTTLTITTTTLNTTTTTVAPASSTIAPENEAPSDIRPDQEASHTFDCSAGFENWQKGWSDQKKDWCCEREQTGCAETTSLPFDCAAGFDNWQKGWSEHKKEWCCTHEKKGCQDAEAAEEDTTTGRTSTTSVIDSDYAGGFPFAAGDSAPVAGCDSVCVRDGLRATCRQRVLYAADHRFDAPEIAEKCQEAVEYVGRQCPDCAACGLEESGCGAEGAERS